MVAFFNYGNRRKRQLSQTAAPYLKGVWPPFHVPSLHHEKEGEDANGIGCKNPLRLCSVACFGCVSS